MSSLNFGPAELFWVAILRVTVIGSLGSVIKGLFAGAFGLWISMIGYSPVLGVERFVFTDHLGGGVNIIDANLNYRHYLNTTRIAREIPPDEPSVKEIFGAYQAKYDLG